MKFYKWYFWCCSWNVMKPTNRACTPPTLWNNIIMEHCHQALKGLFCSLFTQLHCVCMARFMWWGLQGWPLWGERGEVKRMEQQWGTVVDWAQPLFLIPLYCLERRVMQDSEVKWNWAWEEEMESILSFAVSHHPCYNCQQIKSPFTMLSLFCLTVTDEAISLFISWPMSF